MTMSIKYLQSIKMSIKNQNKQSQINAISIVVILEFYDILKEMILVKLVRFYLNAQLMVTLTYNPMIGIF